VPVSGSPQFEDRGTPTSRAPGGIGSIVRPAVGGQPDAEHDGAGVPLDGLDAVGRELAGDIPRFARDERLPQADVAGFAANILRDLPADAKVSVSGRLLVPAMLDENALWLMPVREPDRRAPLSDAGRLHERHALGPLGRWRGWTTSIGR
jgi:hypothetical protein